ncbi:sigma-54-dependent transcriptional regulator [Ascidiimonas sp. W6]|uniref:sigma-54-dependent transcriptional regulator n=1 Tax=Ascidiimonas meishanensis TaxID=3128903 RepID=UPI0030ED2EC5
MPNSKEKSGTILIVDDHASILQAAKLFLKRHFKEIDTLISPDSIPIMLADKSYDLILLDMNFTKDTSSGVEGFFWLKKILEIDPSAVIVLMTAYGNVKTAIKAIKEGASNFIIKPWDNDELLATLHSSIQMRNNKLKIAQLQQQKQELNSQINNRYKEIIGHSTAILKIFKLIDRVAVTDANVLILGENGTGKELIARAIHRNSKQKDQNFVSVDLGAISETLFESELFGHKKGAFTDAKEDRMGRFEAADNGTLFLDEIGNLSLPLQAKLLQALQNRRITPVGSNKEIPVNIRLICATNMNIDEMIADQTFRQDLLYRINTIEIKLPPLRERIDDISLLAYHFLKKYAKEYLMNIKGISKEAINLLQSYHWPGNVRELQHVIERAIIICDSEILQPVDFDLKTISGQANSSTQNSQMNLQDTEKNLIKKSLTKNDGNIAKTADELGLTRQSLYRRLKKYDL